MKKKSTATSKSKKRFVRVRLLGRRAKYTYPVRLSFMIEGNVSLALEEAIEKRIGGKADITGVCTDAIMMYIEKNSLVVPNVEAYAKLKLKEVVVP